MSFMKIIKIVFLTLTVGYTLMSFAKTITKDKSFMMNPHVNSEQHFIEMMRTHHEDGIEMAKMALEKSQNAKIKIVSQKIIDAQTAEVAQFVKWKKQWYSQEDTNINNMAEMSMPMMDTSTLKSKSGKDFDSDYLKSMSIHHEGAIKMANQALPYLQHEEVKNLAKKIVQDQTAEINQLKQIQKTL